MFGNNTPLGSYRQKSSGALIFPATEKELKAERTQKELEQQLEETKLLKAELQELINEAKENNTDKG